MYSERCEYFYVKLCNRTCILGIVDFNFAFFILITQTPTWLIQIREKSLWIIWIRISKERLSFKLNLQCVFDWCLAAVISNVHKSISTVCRKYYLNNISKQINVTRMKIELVYFHLSKLIVYNWDLIISRSWFDFWWLMN